VITSANGVRSLELMRWGLIPTWSKDANVRSQGAELAEPIAV
jgi:putative SOS response-associated peptidase YedK